MLYQVLLRLCEIIEGYGGSIQPYNLLIRLYELFDMILFNSWREFSYYFKPIALLLYCQII